MGAAESSAHNAADSFDQSDHKGFYATLSVSKDATAQQIRRAYLKKALEHHPDKNTTDPESANLRFTKVKEAYETLSDIAKRSVYDMHHPTVSPEEPAAATFERQDESSGWSDGSGNRPEGWYEWLSDRLGSTPSPYYWNDPDSKYGQAGYIFGTFFGTVKPAIGLEELSEFLTTLPEDLNWYPDHVSKSAYTTIGSFFFAIAKDECRWSGLPLSSYPIFGCGRSVWACSEWNDEDQRFIHGSDLRQFYDYWSKFKTVKTFNDPGYMLDPRSWRDPATQRSSIYQDRVRRHYNLVIQTLVRALRDVDPRYRIHIERTRVHDPVHDIGKGNLDERETQKQRRRQKKKDKKRRRKGNW